MERSGTTNDARSCWFTASTPNITTVIYIGCDDNTPLGSDVLASRAVLPIWLDFNAKIDHGGKNRFIYDARLQEIWIDEKTGQLSEKNSPGAITLLLAKA